MKLVGRDPEEKDWTAPELEKQGTILAMLNGRVVQMLDAVDRVRDKFMTNALMESSGGNS
jgi:hypothetical protein